MTDQINLLLVEDEPDLAFMTKTRLELAGFSVRSVGSGEDALAEVARPAPEVLLLDLRLPGIDGMEVLQHVRISNPNLPVIVLSAHASEWRIAMAADLGATTYMTKPADLKQLAETCRRLARPALA